MSLMLRLLWAPVGWTLGLAWMALVVIFGIPTTLFFPFRRWYPFIRPMMAQAFIWATTIKPTITYMEGFDPERRGIFIQNHVSALDALVACSVIPHGFCGLENAAHYRVPIYGWIMSLAHGIRVPKQREGRYEAIRDQARQRKEMGLSILAFPEGHRTMTGTMRPFRSGSFRMAAEIGYPIIPIASRGLYQVMPKGTGLFQRHPVHFTVGPAFETEGLDEKGLTVLMKDVHEWIQKHSGE